MNTLLLNTSIKRHTEQKRNAFVNPKDRLIVLSWVYGNYYEWIQWKYSANWLLKTWIVRYTTTTKNVILCRMINCNVVAAILGLGRAEGTILRWPDGYVSWWRLLDRHFMERLWQIAKEYQIAQVLSQWKLLQWHVCLFFAFIFRLRMLKHRLTDSDMMLQTTRSVRMERTLVFLCYSLTQFISFSLSLWRNIPTVA